MAIRGASSASPTTDMAQWQRATIAQVVTETPRVKTFRFELERPFAFKAGQHVDVRLTAEDGYQAQRSYSIATAPNDGTAIDLTIEQLRDGEVSPYFHEIAQIGDEIELRGPIGGHFVWSPRDGGPILLLGGGSGIVPLMSMIRHRASTGSGAAMLLLYSARNWDELIYRDELSLLAERRDGFHFVAALTRSLAHRGGDYERRVDAAMMREVMASLPQVPRLTFVCGSNPFVEAATQSAIAAGIPARHIRTERYGG